MDEQQARENVKPLGNVDLLGPGEGAGAEIVELYSVLGEPVPAVVDIVELRIVESTLRTMGIDYLADQIDQALRGGTS